MTDPILWFDLEGSSDSGETAELLTFSGIIDVNFQEEHRFDLRCRPDPNGTIQLAALDVNGIGFDEMQLFPEREQVFKDVNVILHKFVNPFSKDKDKPKFFMAGYNIWRYDEPLLRRWWKKENNFFGATFHHYSLDLYPYIRTILAKQIRDLPNLKLRTVCEFFGIQIDEEQLHTSIYDVELTKELAMRSGFMDLIKEGTAWNDWIETK